MQINENEARDDQTREILDYYRGLPQRSSQETIVEMLRELQDVHGCISPDMLEQAAEAAGVRDSMVQAICKRYPSLKTAPYNHEIILCTGRNCASKGSLTVMDELKKRLGVGKNGISDVYKRQAGGRGPPPGRSFVFAINRFTVIICPARVRTSCPPYTVCRLKAYRES